jgi:HK97 gp10 family phage protein
MAIRRVGVYEVEGMPELIQEFNKLSGSLDDYSIKSAFVEVGSEMRLAMQSRIHDSKRPHKAKGGKRIVIPGNLRKSIVVKSFKRKGDGQAFVAVDYRYGPHAHLVEYGHGGPKPARKHPFFRPVVDEFSHNGRLARVVGDAIKKKVESK